MGCNHPRDPSVPEAAPCPVCVREAAIKDYLDAARAASEEFKDDEALRHCQSILTLDPNHAEAGTLFAAAGKRLNAFQLALRLADEAFNKGNYPEALGHYHNAVKLRPNDEAVKHKQSLASILARTDVSQYVREAADDKKSWGEASVIQTEVVPSSVSVWVMGALIAIGGIFLSLQGYQAFVENSAESHFEEFRIQLEQHRALTPRTRSIYRRLVKEFGNTEAARRAREAVFEYEQQQRRDQMGNTQQHFEEGRAAYRKGDYEGAIAIWRKILQYDPENQSAKQLIQEAQVQVMWKMRHVRDYVQRGSFLERVAQPEQPEQSVQAAPADGSAAAASAAGSPKPGDSPRPASVASVASEAPAPAVSLPRNVQEHVRRGQRLFDRGRYDDAVSEWEAAIALAPGQTKPLQFMVTKTRQLAETNRARYLEWFGRGEALEREGRRHEALIAFREAVKYASDGSQERKKVGARIQAIQHVLRESEGLASAEGVWNRCLYEVRIAWGRLTSCVTVWRRWGAPEQQPDMPSATVSAGAAVDAGSRRKWPGDPLIGHSARQDVTVSDRQLVRWVSAAEEAERQEDWRGANRYYRKIKAAKSDPAVRQRILLNQLMQEQARRLTVAPDDFHAAMIYGAGLFDLRMYDEAVAVWRRSLNWQRVRAGRTQMLHGCLAAALAQQEQASGAVEMLRAIVAAGNIYWARQTLAELLWSLGEYEEAMLLWTQLVEEAPDQFRPQVLLARAIYFFGDMETLRKRLQAIEDISQEALLTRQITPPYADPTYFLGDLIGPKRYLSDTAGQLSDLYRFLDRPLEAVRWAGFAQLVLMKGGR